MSIVNHPAIGLPPFSDPWSYRTPFSPWWGTSWTALDAGLIVHYVGHVVFFAESSHSFSKACYGMTRDNKKCSADLWWLKLCSKGDQVKIKMMNLNLPKQTIWAAFTIQGRFCNRKKELINRRICVSYDVHVGKSLVAFHFFWGCIQIHPNNVYKYMYMYTYIMERQLKYSHILIIQDRPSYRTILVDTTLLRCPAFLFPGRISI